MSKINDILKQRGTRYGIFYNQAMIAQGIHRMVEIGMMKSGKTQFDFMPDEREALNMIINKIARIVNGDPHYSDNWRDIAGYATLVADRIDSDNKNKEVGDGRKRIEEGTGENRAGDAGTTAPKRDPNPDGGGRPSGQVHVHWVSIANNDIRK